MQTSFLASRLLLTRGPGRESESEKLEAEYMRTNPEPDLPRVASVLSSCLTRIFCGFPDRDRDIGHSFQTAMATTTITVGVLALQGGFAEHLSLLRRASEHLKTNFSFLQVRNKEHLNQCDALIIPGGESTTMAIVAARLGLLEPLRHFVK